MPLEPKTPEASSVQEQVYQVFPNDLNHNGTVFGGLIMAHMDRLSGVVASRHAQSVVVTASVDAVHFMLPAHGSDVLVMCASVNRAWHTSMEIGCKVEAENPTTGKRRHVLSAYLTFVATDANGKAREVPTLLPQSVAEKRRFAEADVRRRNRLHTAEQLRHLKASAG